MKITFVINNFFRKPVGGAKIIYQYANHFAKSGHDVTIVFGISRPLIRYEGKLPYAIRRMITSYSVKHGPRWFALEPDIRKVFAEDISGASVPDGDVVFATAVETARPVAALSICKGKKCYLIQDFEDWGCSAEEVYDTYRLGMTNITISKWLDCLVREHSGRDTVYIPNAVDSNIFRVVVPNHERYTHSISMLYHSGSYKGFSYGLAVIMKLKQHYPDLKCHIFGVGKRVAAWPGWIQYTRRATQVELVEIYNSTSVFLCSSVEEGFGLCGAESMACGCVLVSTGYRGVYTYAQNEVNALISPVKDVEALYANVCRVFEHEDLRETISRNGVESIQQFSWDSSFAKMDALVGELFEN